MNLELNILELTYPLVVLLICILFTKNLVKTASEEILVNLIEKKDKEIDNLKEEIDNLNHKLELKKIREQI